MGIFEHFPYTNYHDLNLDKILERTKEAEQAVAASEAAVLEAAADMAAASAAATNAVNTANAASNAATNAVNTANSAVNTANAASTTAGNAYSASIIAGNTATAAANSASAAAADALAAKNAAEALSAASMVIYDFSVSSGVITPGVTITATWIRQLISDVTSGNAILRFHDSSAGDAYFVTAFSSVPNYEKLSADAAYFDGIYLAVRSSDLLISEYAIEVDATNILFSGSVVRTKAIS